MNADKKERFFVCRQCPVGKCCTAEIFSNLCVERLLREVESLQAQLACKTELLIAATKRENTLIDRLAASQARERTAVEGLEWLALTTVDSLRCNICKYNPDDMGCELDGSQFDDGGECHFVYWRLGRRQKRCGALKKLG